MTVFVHLNIGLSNGFRSGLLDYDKILITIILNKAEVVII